MPRVIPPPLTEEPAWIHPVLGGGQGPYAHAVIGEPGGLTRFGLHLEVLPPGSRSSFRHWHADEDEMIFLPEGELVLIADTETPLRAGEAACWPAGHPVGHCLENRGDRPARYLVVGTRAARDVIRYPDHGLTTHRDGDLRRHVRDDAAGAG